MATMTISLPDELREDMKQFTHINWSGFVREQVTKKLDSLKQEEELRRLLKQEQQDLSWTVELGRELKANR